MKHAFKIFFIFLIHLCAFSQSPWDLQQCIQYAISHNISLKQSALNNEINKNNSNQSKANVLPTLNVGAQHNYNFGKTVDRFSGTFANTQFLSQNFFASTNLVLWSGLSQYNTIRANEFNYLSGIENLKQQENDLSLNVANAYINVVFSEELLKISTSQFNVTKEQLEQTMKLVNAGALAKSVEYDIRAQLANEELNVTNADNNSKLAVLGLRQLMNYDSIANFDVSRPTIEIENNTLLENNVQYIYETALKNQHNIKSGEYAIMSADRTYAASKGRISPSLSLTGSIGTGYSGVAKRLAGYNNVTDTLGNIPGIGPLVYNRQDPLFEETPFSNQVKDNVNKTIGFTLNIPLFNGLQTHTSIKNAKISLLNSRYTQELNQQNLYKTIAQAHMNAKAALNKYNASKSNVTAASESFKYAQQKFNAGSISAFDFTNSKNRLFAAESNLLQAKYDYLFKIKVLDFYQGKPLTF
ncbi:MAG: TolC family protein [Sphingobacteriaceae bacterium]|nr:TolC family protein [Sphingobacteriaceae bacterium]